MSRLSASRDDPDPGPDPGDSGLASLERHTSILRARKDALECLAATSADLRAALESNDDLTEHLQRREADCQRFAALCHDEDRVIPPGIDTWRDDTDAEIAGLSQCASSLDSDIQRLIERVAACQGECETIMRTRLDSLAAAIRESAQRRKLGAAYGPALSHDTPVFLDKQR